jgi:hypothetical protein
MGPIAYKLALPPNVKTHNVFHVSLLKKYVHDSNHIIDWVVIQVELEGEFQPGPSEATWEMEDAMKEAYPFLFSSQRQLL